MSHSIYQMNTSTQSHCHRTRVEVLTLNIVLHVEIGECLGHSIAHVVTIV